MNKSALLGLAGAAVLVIAAIVIHTRKPNPQSQPGESDRPAQIAANAPAPAPPTDAPQPSAQPAAPEATTPPAAAPEPIAAADPSDTQPSIAPAESRPAEPLRAAVVDEPETPSEPAPAKKPAPKPITPPPAELARPGRQPEFQPDDPDVQPVPDIAPAKQPAKQPAEPTIASPQPEAEATSPDKSSAPESDTWPKQWLGLVDEHNARKQQDASTPTKEPTAQPDATSLIPPPAMHTIDGIGGGLLTPTAYLVNPGPADEVLAPPAVSLRFWRFGSKDIETLAISETLFGRIELSYAVSRFGLGSFRDAVRKTTGRDIVRNDAYLHTFGLRGLLLQENAFDLDFMPAITAGVQFKYNDSIQTIDRRSGRLLHSAGLDKSNGIDWTLTTSKTIRDPFFHKPLSLSAGLRVSKAAQIGLLGFGNDCKVSLETNIRYQPTDWLIVGYELRDKVGPYATGPNTLESEGPWQAITASFVLDERLILTTAWTMMGNVANGPADCGWNIGLQYNF